MKFKYKKYNLETLRPVIPIEVRFQNIAIPYEVLVDSGADMCIFDAQLADIFGMDLLKGTKQQVSGITGFSENIYIHSVKVNVGGLYYKLDAGFMHLRNSSYGVVGQKGFFDLFIVKFDLKKEEIEVKPR